MTINHANAGPNRALKHSSKKQAGKSGNSDVIRLQDHSSFTNLRARVNHRKKRGRRRPSILDGRGLLENLVVGVGIRSSRIFIVQT